MNKALTRTYVYEQTILTNDERDEHKRMLARLRTKRYKGRQQDDDGRREHHRAVRRAAYHKNREKLTAKRRERHARKNAK